MGLIPRFASTLILLLVSFSARASDPGLTQFIVPYPPGGVVDLIARAAQQPLQAALARTVVIDNAAGAAGAIGMQKLLSMPADGGAMAFGTDSDTLLVPLSNPAVRYRPEQLRLIGLLASAPLVLVASAQRPDLTMPAVLARARLRGAKPFDCGNVGLFSNMHMIASAFGTQTGVPLTHVPYKGIAPLVGDLLGGHLELAFLPLAGPIPDMVRAGKLSVLAVTTARPVESLPATPTVAAAAGIPTFEFSSWSGVVVSRTMPEAAVARLHAAVQATVQDPGYQRAMDKAGVATPPP